MKALQAASHLSPDPALLLLTGGLLLIYVELNRPGWIVPGAFGLLLTLLSVASLLRFNLSPAAAVLVLVAAATLGLSFLRHVQGFVLCIAAIALALGFVYLVTGPGPSRVRLPTGVLCGAILGVVTPLLAGIARSARRSKRGKLI